MNLDATDRAILKVLQANGRITNVELADQISLSPSACLRRVRALERAGVIDRYVALVNPAAVGLPDHGVRGDHAHLTGRRPPRRLRGRHRPLPRGDAVPLMARRVRLLWWSWPAPT